MMDFPHVSNKQFPPPQKQIKYENDFDYNRWAEYQTDIVLCNVPWSTPEIVLGTRVKSGYGKVVKFENDTARDAYFDSLENSISFPITYRGFSQTEFRVKIPFDMCMSYNYLYVNYSPATAQDSLISYEGVNGVKRIYYFIRDIEYLAPNTTKITVLLDYWTTFINSLKIKQLGVERGHVAENVTVDEFLSNPLNNCESLCSKDIEPIETNFSGGEHFSIFNDGEQYALIASTADFVETANSEYWIISKPIELMESPSLYCFAVPVNMLYNLMSYIDNYLPHYKATITGVYIVPSKYIDGSTVYVDDIPITLVAQKLPLLETIELNRTDFPVSDTIYKDITKMYTSPYSILEINDFRGNSVNVKIQDISDEMKLQATLSVAAPFVAINANVLGVSETEITELTFNNCKTIKYYSNGIEDELEWTYEIPVYAVTQQPSIDYDIHTLREREQAQIAYENNYNSAVALAEAAYSNSITGANAQDAIANYHISYNSDKTTGANILTDAQSNAAQLKVSSDNVADYVYSRDALIANIEAIGASAWINAVNGVVTGGAQGAIQGGMSSGMLGAAGGAIGAVGGALVGAVTAGASASVAITKDSTINALSVANNGAHTNNAVDYMETNRVAQNIYNNTLETIENDLTLNATSANTSAMRTQAATSRNASITAAQNTRNTAINDIANKRKQARLNEPRLFGTFSGDGIAQNIKPMGLSFTVKGLNKSETKRIGDEFTRYGYYVNQWFDFQTFNIKKEFTYWKCFDFMIESKLPDIFTDRIKMLLSEGITVYRKPDYINHSIYANL